MGAMRRMKLYIWLAIAILSGLLPSQLTMTAAAASTELKAGLEQNVVRSVDLYKGNALVDPKSPTTVNTAEGQLVVRPGSQVFVMTSGDNISMFHLNEINRGDVQFVHNKKSITLGPGQELVITKDSNVEFADTPGKVIPYRTLTKHQLDDGATVYSAEFSVLSLVKAVKPLKAKLTSTNPKDRETIHTILKNGLILNQANSHKGEFKGAAQKAKEATKSK